MLTTVVTTTVVLLYSQYSRSTVQYQSRLEDMLYVLHVVLLVRVLFLI